MLHSHQSVISQYLIWGYMFYMTHANPYIFEIKNNYQLLYIYIYNLQYNVQALSCIIKSDTTKNVLIKADIS